MTRRHVPREQAPFSERVGSGYCVPRQFIDMSDIKTLPDGDVVVHHGSSSETVAHRGRKVEWCHNCRAGDHSKCNGRRIKKYERGYAPCECAAHGHGRKDEQPRT